MGNLYRMHHVEDALASQLDSRHVKYFPGHCNPRTDEKDKFLVLTMFILIAIIST